MKRKKVTIPRIEALQARADIYYLIKNANGLLRAKNAILADTLRMSIRTFERHMAWLIKSGFLRQLDGIGRGCSTYTLGVYHPSVFKHFLTIKCYAKGRQEVDELNRMRVIIEAIDRSKSDEFFYFDEEDWFKEAQLQIQIQLLDEEHLETFKQPATSKLQDDVILRASPRNGTYVIDGVKYPAMIYAWEECEGEDLFCSAEAKSYQL